MQPTELVGDDPRGVAGEAEETMRVQQGLIRGLAMAFALWAGAAGAGEPVRLDAVALDQVTAGAGGFAYFFGAGTAGFNGAGGLTIEGGGTATYEEEIKYTPSTGLKFKRNARASYSGSSKAQANGGTASATLAAGSGVVLN
jgi:hypothetical protein